MRQSDEVDEVDTLKLKDRIRMSVGLIKQIHEMPEHRSEVVVVDRMRREEDGCIVLYLTRETPQ